MNAPTAVALDLAIELRVSNEQIEEHVGYSPVLLGEQLALQVIAYVREHQLGYFPPFDFLEKNVATDPDLLILMQELANYSSHFAKRVTRRYLAAHFASVRVRHIFSPFFAMPKIRIHAANALAELSQHYFPSQVRVELAIICMGEELQDMHKIEKNCALTAQRVLAPQFEKVHIAYAKCSAT